MAAKCNAETTIRGDDDHYHCMCSLAPGHHGPHRDSLQAAEWTDVTTTFEPDPVAEPLAHGDPRLPALHAGPDFKERLAEYCRLRGFRVWRDSAELEGVVEAVFEESPFQAAKFVAGEEKFRGPLIAQVMKKTLNGADPAVLKGVMDAKVNKGGDDT